MKSFGLILSSHLPSVCGVSAPESINRNNEKDKYQLVVYGTTRFKVITWFYRVLDAVDDKYDDAWYADFPEDLRTLPAVTVEVKPPNDPEVLGEACRAAARILLDSTIGLSRVLSCLRLRGAGCSRFAFFVAETLGWLLFGLCRFLSALSERWMWFELSRFLSALVVRSLCSSCGRFFMRPAHATPHWSHYPIAVYVDYILMRFDVV